MGPRRRFGRVAAGPRRRRRLRPRLHCCGVGPARPFRCRMRRCRRASPARARTLRRNLGAGAGGVPPRRRRPRRHGRIESALVRDGRHRRSRRPHGSALARRGAHARMFRRRRAAAAAARRAAADAAVFGSHGRPANGSAAPQLPRCRRALARRPERQRPRQLPPLSRDHRRGESGRGSPALRRRAPNRATRGRSGAARLRHAPRPMARQDRRVGGSEPRTLVPPGRAKRGQVARPAPRGAPMPRDPEIRSASLFIRLKAHLLRSALRSRPVRLPKSTESHRRRPKRVV
mmetsp:Transcript_30291/g.102169  ORF Transcript_30291/g.102169 Transcript_30291/m.102169 type:complete len:289 (+) Transcript_30291:216-1082(+)